MVKFERQFCEILSGKVRSGASLKVMALKYVNEELKTLAHIKSTLPADVYNIVKEDHLIYARSKNKFHEQLINNDH